MPGNSLNFIRRGAGVPPIVFVHGFLCRHQDWAPQVAHFAETSDVVALDLRGHGASPRGDRPMSIETVGGDVADLLRAEGLSGAVLVGHSMGCRVVMEARRRAPDRVAGLVMVDGSRFAEDPATAMQAIDAVIAEKGYKVLMRAMFDGMFFGDPPPWKAEKIEQVLAIPEETGLPLFRSMIAYDAGTLDTVLAELAAANVPLHVIQSTAIGPDRARKALLPGELSPYQRLLMDRVPGTTCESVTAGHFCMLEAPDAVNDSIAGFIADRIAH
jgi:pimeloyl-ACP methyl ester carboxylesterase